MPDYIRTYLGLLGSGKTTCALRDVQACRQLIFYSAVVTHRDIFNLPLIYDTPNYLAHLEGYLKHYGKIRIEKRALPSEAFQAFVKIRNCAFVVDDVTAVKTDPKERTDFDAWIRSVRYNGNRVILTTHRARRDLSPLIHNLGNSFYYVGPSIQSRKELETMYDLTNYPISFEEFSHKLINNQPHQIFPIRRSE